MKKIVALAIAAIMAASLSACGNDITRYSEEPQVSKNRFVTGCGNCYIVTDTETGVQYLFVKSGYGGGLTVLVDADGNPIVASGKQHQGSSS